MFSKQKILLIALVFITLLLLVFGYIYRDYFFHSALTKNIISDTNRQNIEKLDVESKNKKSIYGLDELNSNLLFKDALLAEKNYEYEKAFKEYESVLQNTSLQNFSKNKNLVETAKLASANALMELDREKGLAYYLNIFSDKNTSLVNKSYALLRAQQNCIAFNDIKALRPFITNAVKEVNKLNDEEILYNVNKTIYQLHPFPIAAARIGIYELGKEPNAKNAQRVYDLYFKALEGENMKAMFENPGFRHMAANTLNAFAQLSSSLLDYKVTNVSSTTELYEKTYSTAILYSPRGTQHFMLASFANHQAKIKNIEESIFLIDKLRQEGISANVKARFLKDSELNKFYPNIFDLYKNNATMQKAIKAIRNS